MHNQFDELTKSMAQSVTRRGALKTFGVGLAGMALACFGLVSKTKGGSGHLCQSTKDCAHMGPSAVCCKNLGGLKSCVFHKTECARGQIIF